MRLLRADKMSTSNIDENEDEDRAISVDITKENFLFQGRLISFVLLLLLLLGIFMNE